MQFEIPVPLMVLIGIVVVALSILSIWQYVQALKKQAQQQVRADRILADSREQQVRADRILADSREQQQRTEAILSRQEALLARAEALVSRLEERRADAPGFGPDRGVGS